MIPKRAATFLLAFTLLTLTTAGVVFFAEGYKINILRREVRKTGMLLVSSSPTGAKIYLNGKLVDTTNATLGSLEPGTYQLEITKEGFVPWEKEVTVFPELATEVDAFLISKSPRLEPLTKTGVGVLCASPDKHQIAYTSRSEGAKGLWVLDLTSPTVLGLVRENPRPIILDTKEQSYSLAENITYSPKGDQVLLTLNQQGYLLLDVGNGNPPTATTSAEPILSLWNQEERTLREKWSDRLKLKGKLREIALDPKTKWSADRTRFLYTQERDGYIEWHVYNGEEPLGVGRKREYVPLKAKKGQPVQVFWHSSNRHLIVQDQGTISLIELDGGNRTEILSLKLDDPRIFPTPDGSSLIILTSFKKNGVPNLYAIGLK